jgi:hypothetical protein
MVRALREIIFIGSFCLNRMLLVCLLLILLLWFELE